MELYGRMLTLSAVGHDPSPRVRLAGGGCLPVPLERWLGEVSESDELVVRCATAPVLDVGCGPGRLLAALAAAGKPALGVDPCAAAVRLARRARCRDAGLGVRPRRGRRGVGDGAAARRQHRHRRLARRLDTQGGALLVFKRDPDLELVRRLYLPGGPYGIALDTEHGRLFVTVPARNEVVELPAHGRPHVLRRWPTVRQPNSVAVDPLTRRVYVAGLKPSALQVLSAAAPLP